MDDVAIIIEENTGNIITLTYGSTTLRTGTVDRPNIIEHEDLRVIETDDHLLVMNKGNIFYDQTNLGNKPEKMVTLCSLSGDVNVHLDGQADASIVGKAIHVIAKNGNVTGDSDFFAQANNNWKIPFICAFSKTFSNSTGCHFDQNSGFLTTAPIKQPDLLQWQFPYIVASSINDPNAGLLAVINSDCSCWSQCQSSDNICCYDVYVAQGGAVNNISFDYRSTTHDPNVTVSPGVNKLNISLGIAQDLTITNLSDFVGTVTIQAAWNVILPDGLNISGGDITIIAGGSIISHGDIYAQNNITLIAGKDIIIDNAVSGITVSGGGVTSIRVIAGGHISVTTNTTGGLQGIINNNPGGDVLVAAGKSINIPQSSTNIIQSSTPQNNAVYGIASYCDAGSGNVCVVSGDDITINSPSLGTGSTCGIVSRSNVAGVGTVYAVSGGQINIHGAVDQTNSDSFCGIGNCTFDSYNTISTASQSVVALAASTIQIDNDKNLNSNFIEQGIPNRQGIASYTTSGSGSHISALSGDDLTIKNGDIEPKNNVMGVSLLTAGKCTINNYAVTQGVDKSLMALLCGISCCKGSPVDIAGTWPSGLIALPQTGRVATTRNLAHFDDMLNILETENLSVIYHTGDITISNPISLSNKNLLIMSLNGNVTINASITCSGNPNDIFILAPKGSIEINGILTCTRLITFTICGTVTMSGTITQSIGTFICNQTVDSPSWGDYPVVTPNILQFNTNTPGQPMSGSYVVNDFDIPQSSPGIMTAGDSTYFTVISTKNLTILPSTTTKNIYIYTTGNVDLPNGITLNGAVSIWVIAGGNITAGGEGILVYDNNHIEPGSITLVAGGNIDVNTTSAIGSGSRGIGVYNTTASVNIFAMGHINVETDSFQTDEFSCSGIFCYNNYSENSGNVTVVCGSDLTMSVAQGTSTEIGQVTGIASRAGQKSGIVSVISGGKIDVTSPNASGVSGIGSHGGTGDAPVHVIACGDISTQSGTATNSGIFSLYGQCSENSESSCFNSAVMISSCGTISCHGSNATFIGNPVTVIAPKTPTFETSVAANYTMIYLIVGCKAITNTVKLLKDNIEVVSPLKLLDAKNIDLTAHAELASNSNINADKTITLDLSALQDQHQTQSERACGLLCCPCEPIIVSNISLSNLSISSSVALSPIALSKAIAVFDDMLCVLGTSNLAYIFYPGDITISQQINLLPNKTLVIMSCTGNITINNTIFAKNIYLMAPNGSITINANLTATGSTAATATGPAYYSRIFVFGCSIAYTNTPTLSASGGTIILNQDKPTTGVTFAANCVITPDQVSTAPDATGVCTGGITLTDFTAVSNSDCVITNGTGMSIKVNVLTNKNLRITFTTPINKSIEINAPCDVILTNGLVAAGEFLDITIRAGGSIICESGPGIITHGTLLGQNAASKSGSISLLATQNISVHCNSAASFSIADETPNASGIASYGWFTAGHVSVIACGAIFVTSIDVNTAQNQVHHNITGVISYCGNGINGGSISVISGEDVSVNSGKINFGSASGIVNWGWYGSSSTSVISARNISVTAGDSYGNLSSSGISSWCSASPGIPTSGNVCAIARGSVTVSSGSADAGSSTGVASWAEDGTSNAVSVIAYGDIDIASRSADLNSSASGIASKGDLASGPISIVGGGSISIDSDAANLSGISTAGQVIVSACKDITLLNQAQILGGTATTLIAERLTPAITPSPSLTSTRRVATINEGECLIDIPQHETSYTLTTNVGTDSYCEWLTYDGANYAKIPGPTLSLDFPISKYYAVSLRTRNNGVYSCRDCRFVVKYPKDVGCASIAGLTQALFNRTSPDEEVYPLPPPDFYQNNINNLVKALTKNEQVVYGGTRTADPKSLLGFDSSASYILYNSLATSSKSYLQHRNDIFEFNIPGGLSTPCTVNNQTCYTGAKPIRGIIISHGRVMVLFQTEVFGKLIAELQKDQDSGLYYCSIDVLNRRIS